MVLEGWCGAQKLDNEWHHDHAPDPWWHTGQTTKGSSSSKSTTSDSGGGAGAVMRTEAQTRSHGGDAEGDHDDYAAEPEHEDDAL